MIASSRTLASLARRPHSNPLVRPLSTSVQPLLSPVRPVRQRARTATRQRRTAEEFLNVPKREPPTGITGSPILEQAHDVEVDIPEDSRGVLKNTHGSRVLLGQSALVITRQIEMLNIFLGYEQGNKYQICTPEGEQVGFIAEIDQGMMGTISRQALKTHRPFRAVILDKEGNPILWVRRPFQLINSRIYVEAREGPDAPLVGEAQQDWHLWRRKYNLFLSRPTHDPETGEAKPSFDQFAAVDEGLLAWEFWLRDSEGQARASVSRNFGGFGREIFTDTGTYVLRFDAVNQEIEQARIEGRVDPKTGVEIVLPQPSTGAGLTLDERAVMLATAISIDFDYFSRHSGGMMPFFPFFGGGGGGSDLDSASSTPLPPDGQSLEGEQDPDTMEGAELPPGMRGDHGLGGPAEDRPWWESDTGGEEVMGDKWGTSVGEEEVWGEEEEGGGGGTEGW